MTRLISALGVVLALATAPAAAERTIRVALGDGLRLVEVAGADLVTVSEPGSRRPLFGLAGGQAVRIAPAPPGLEVGPRRLAMPGVRLETGRGPLRVGTRDYGGVLEVWRSGEGLLLVNELGLEEYIAGTVRAEASEKWPLESLRAMAVVARTYAVFLQRRNRGRPYDLVAGNQDQNYAGHVADDSPAREAAHTTAGQVLTWRGSVFPTFYHSDSGGFTEPAQTVFSGDGVPPLPGIRDEFSFDSPNYVWAITIPLATVADRLRQAGFDVGEIRGLTVLERSPSSRVASIAVEHSRGSTRLKGTEFRRAVGYDILKSTLFVPVPGPDGAVRFEGRGWGHGVGLSQFGAKGMAERGYTYAQILQHYYPGTVLQVLR